MNASNQSSTRSPSRRRRRAGAPPVSSSSVATMQPMPRSTTRVIWTTTEGATVQSTATSPDDQPLKIR